MQPTKRQLERRRVYVYRGDEIYYDIKDNGFIGKSGFTDAKLICHPEVKNERYYGWVMTKNTALTFKKLSKQIELERFDTFFSKNEMHISDNFLYSGEIRKKENKQ
ncbi:hypothetical protein [Xenorhabdus khoisanae]|uniref:hypothetical protein n=1 Tax=Xenorhabdus khoisanae TaxID=880157 RepID=UPI00069F7DA3|nr:hypothetical protein [Xenorhabdus khoisanae]